MNICYQLFERKEGKEGRNIRKRSKNYGVWATWRTKEKINAMYIDIDICICIKN